MNWLTNLKIDIQRWSFRRKQKMAKRLDDRKMTKAIYTANKQSEKTKKRLWVLKIATADYRIYTRSQIRSALRGLGVAHLINMYQPNEYIIHITNKPKE